MKIRTYLASLTLALWFSGAQAADTPLALLVRAYRQAPTPLHRNQIVSYAAAHPKEAPLANLALGIAAYEQRDYPAAIQLLKLLPGQLPKVGDYAAYFLAASQVEAADADAVPSELTQVRRDGLVSPFIARSWMLEARAVKTADPAAAVRILTTHYDELPQPEADVTLADAYQAANNFAKAAELYQKVYYGYVSGESANRAAAAILTLRDTMAGAWPTASVEMQLRRADRLLDAREYVKAKAEYAGIASDFARVGEGAADFLRGATSTAHPYLRDLSVTGEADAERLYYLVECARRSNDEGELQSGLQRLAAKYPSSPWRLRALTSAANRYLLDNRTTDFVGLDRAIYEDFPTSTAAANAHWKVTFQAWLHNDADAPKLLRDHLRLYPTHSTAGSALYFLGRAFQQTRDAASAKACFTRLSTTFENHYYAMLARERLRVPEIAAATAAPPETTLFLSTIRLTSAPPVPSVATSVTTARIERSRILRSAGLSDLADGELRFGARRDGQPALLALEMASASEAPHEALRYMKVMSPDYLNVPVAGAPRRFWELLYPLPFRTDLVRSATDRNLDPYLLAGLIRQESEFNPQAVSHAKAYGLTQVLPITGRQFARRAGVAQFTTRTLYQPAANLKIGSSILRSMLDAQGGSLEQTLAAYNAGPARVTQWLAWNTYREPAEFVESIPFTETRDYVQAVLRNAEMYRRLYEGR